MISWHRDSQILCRSASGGALDAVIGHSTWCRTERHRLERLLAGMLDANETCPFVCQSCVMTTSELRARGRLMIEVTNFRPTSRVAPTAFGRRHHAGLAHEGTCLVRVEPSGKKPFETVSLA